MKNLVLVGLAVALLAVALIAYRTYGQSEEALTPSARGSGQQREVRRQETALANLERSQPGSERETMATEVAESIIVTSAEPTEEDAEAGAADESEPEWQALLERIRAAATAKDPHRSGWPHVQALARATRRDLVDESPGPIAAKLEALLRDTAAEDPFVRGALLLTLVMAYPTELSHALVREFRMEPTGELARAAWLAGRLTDGEGVDLGRFQVHYSKAARSIWPVTVLASSSDSVLEDALAQLIPTTLYRSGVANDWTLPSVERGREGELTRETIVLALLSGGAREPGPVRDRLLEWAPETDMSHACIWSLCLVARDDPDLALTLRSMLLGLDPSSSEAQLLATLLVDLAKRPDLAFVFLETTLTSIYGGDRGALDLPEYNALFALGKILSSDDPELSERAAQLLTDIALDPTRPDVLRRLTLGELSDADSTRIPDMVELILISPDSAKVKRWAAMLGKFAPESQQQSMRDTLMGTYSSDLAGEVQLSYVKSLISLGGDDVRVFLSQLAGAEGTSNALRQEIEDYLGY